MMQSTMLEHTLVHACTGTAECKLGPVQHGSQHSWLQYSQTPRRTPSAFSIANPPAGVALDVLQQRQALGGLKRALGAVLPVHAGQAREQPPLHAGLSALEAAQAGPRHRELRRCAWTQGLYDHACQGTGAICARLCFQACWPGGIARALWCSLHKRGVSDSRNPQCVIAVIHAHKHLAGLEPGGLSVTSRAACWCAWQQQCIHQAQAVRCSTESLVLHTCACAWLAGQCQGCKQACHYSTHLQKQSGVEVLHWVTPPILCHTHLQRCS